MPLTEGDLQRLVCINVLIISLSKVTFCDFGSAIQPRIDNVMCQFGSNAFIRLFSKQLESTNLNKVCFPVQLVEIKQNASLISTKINRLMKLNHLYKLDIYYGNDKMFSIPNFGSEGVIFGQALHRSLSIFSINPFEKPHDIKYRFKTNIVLFIFDYLNQMVHRYSSSKHFDQNWLRIVSKVFGATWYVGTLVLPIHSKEYPAICRKRNRCSDGFDPTLLAECVRMVTNIPREVLMGYIGDRFTDGKPCYAASLEFSTYVRVLKEISKDSPYYSVIDSHYVLRGLRKSWYKLSSPLRMYIPLLDSTTDYFAVYNHATLDVISRTNGSLGFMKSNKITEEFMPIMFFGLPNHFWNIDTEEFGITQIAMIKNDFYFITCHRLQKLSFEQYGMPFKIEIWVIVVLTVIALVGFFKLYNSKYVTLSNFKERKHKRQKLSFWDILLSPLLNQGVSVCPDVSCRAEFRIVFVSWLLACLILSNCYTSLIIRDLNAPVQGPKINFNSDIHCKPTDSNNYASFIQSQRSKYLENLTPSLRESYPGIPIYPSNSKYTRVYEWLTHVGYSYLSNCFEKHYAHISNRFSQNVSENSLAMRLFVGAYFSKCLGLTDNPEFPSSNCFSILSRPEVSGGNTIRAHPLSYMFMSHALRAEESESNSLTRNSLGFLERFFNSKIRYYPSIGMTDKEFEVRKVVTINKPELLYNVSEYGDYIQEALIEKELIQCGRSLYGGTEDEVDAELQYLSANYPMKKFYKSKTPMHSFFSSWKIHFSQETVSKFPKYLKIYIYDSGLFNFLMKSITKKSLFGRRNYTMIIDEHHRIAPIKITHSIVTIFIILVSALGLTMVFLFLECANKYPAREMALLWFYCLRNRMNQCTLMSIIQWFPCRRVE